MLKNLTIDVNSATYKPTITTTGGALVPYPMGAVYGSRDEIVLSFVDDANSSFPNYTEVSFFASVGGVAFAQTTFTKDGTNWVGVIDWLDNIALGALADRRDVVCRCGFHCVYEDGAVEEWQFPITLFMTSAGYLTDSVEAKRYAGEASEYAEQASEYAGDASEYAYNAGGYAEQASEYAYNASEYAEQIGGRIDCLAQDVSDLQGCASELQFCLLKNAQDVSYLQNDVSYLQGCVTGLRGCVSGLRASVTGLWSNVSETSSYVSGLIDNVSELSGCVSGLRGFATELQGCLDTMNCQLFGTCGEFADVRAEIGCVSNGLDNVCTKIGCVSNELHSNYQKKLVAGDGLYISECSTSASISLCNTEMWCYDEQGGCVNLKLASQPTGVKITLDEVNGNTFSAPVIRATKTHYETGFRADFRGDRGGFTVDAQGVTCFYNDVKFQGGSVEVRGGLLRTYSTAHIRGVRACTLWAYARGTICGTLCVNGSFYLNGEPISATTISCNIEVGESGYTLGQIINAMRQHNFL